MEIKIPELSLVILMGAAGSGKSTFAKRLFLNTEVVSSDFCRALVSDDEDCQEANEDAFAVVHEIVRRRLKRGKFTVVDATNLHTQARDPLRALAKKYHFFPVVVALDVSEKTCKTQNEQRERQVAGSVIHRQVRDFKLALKSLKNEGFRLIFKVKENEMSAVKFTRQPLWNNKSHENGPFDIIGDVHGCIDELKTLLGNLGYTIEKNDNKYSVKAPNTRKAVFVGDLVDRGPDSCEVLRLVMDMVAANVAICVPGNHDAKLMRKLKGRNVQLKHGLAETIAQLEKETPQFRERVKEFIFSLVSHYILDNGNLVVAHAGLKENMQGRGSKAVRDFCLYGETTGETDEFGLPIRYNWASEYKGKAMVVYGHTPIPEAEWFNNTLNIDTGCVFGGKLTALRYPEKEIVCVEAAREYSKPIRPIGTGMVTKELTTQQQYDDLLNVEDYLHKQFIETSLRNVTIREGNAAAALEVMTRYALHPKWLIYLPATMSPCETSKDPQYLEHPLEAFDYYRQNNIERVICEEKHMGSRAVIVICKDKETVVKRFGIQEDRLGVCYTRSGRNFFEDEVLEKQFFSRLHAALCASNFWEKFSSNWVCLDCELMPWSVKAQLLLEDQYAAVATASRTATPHVLSALQLAQQRGIDTKNNIEKYQEREKLLEAYAEVYRGYCWPVKSVEDLRLAPFHILATEGCVHSDKDHLWHMQNIAEVCEHDQMLMATKWKTIAVNNEEDVAEGLKWWLDLTASGKEGMVVKPIDFVVHHGKKLLQPAVKCRGREYLRITYGPEYTLSENIVKLKNRALARKRNLALQEFSLGLESLQRFVDGKPLREVHQCVFGILALESEAVDPRL
ncbi:polynucleotide kinase-phosphatase [Candidatus Uabimicrobium amorphum]|uniref:Polynucleotide kinase-phosphatase n=1 Tax=Uabimicrobium amorphum TaxID=2596890 RepID=A0A5S9ILL9_UABAM|nr:polynucleotide kinase-phosphatase [Candidatus Uabimicrobium amorphum]BBM83602.1 polynucleotide kinase-phosphatase [Candidatus Uabimicrobium amorphum]